MWFLSSVIIKSTIWKPPSSETYILTNAPTDPAFCSVYTLALGMISALICHFIHFMYYILTNAPTDPVFCSVYTLVLGTISALICLFIHFMYFFMEKLHPMHFFATESWWWQHPLLPQLMQYSSLIEFLASDLTYKIIIRIKPNSNTKHKIPLDT